MRNSPAWASMLLLLLTFVGYTAIAETPESVPSEVGCNECDSEEIAELHTTFQTEGDGTISVDGDGNAIVIDSSAYAAPTPIRTRAANPTVSLQAECTTARQGTNRRSCNSSTRVHTVPVGYWINESSKSISYQHRRGSENDAHVSFDNYVQVVPGFYQPRTIKFWVHARSDGVNTRGKTKATVTVEYLRIP